MASCSGGSVREYNKVARLEPLLATLLQDPILADVPTNATLADIDTLISVELGSAMKLSILKMDDTVLDVAIPNNARVCDLKSVVEKKVSGLEQAELGHRHISWRHVWKNYCLCYLNQKLLDDLASLQDYGIRNNCQVRFVSHIATKENGQHSRAKRRRFFHGFVHVIVSILKRNYTWTAVLLRAIVHYLQRWTVSPCWIQKDVDNDKQGVKGERVER